VIATAAAQATAVLDVSNVSLELGGRLILENVGFQVAPGEIVGLIGPNGAGKTTLMRSILGDITPLEGTIGICSHQHAHAGEIGYVPQHISLDPDLPLRACDLVALGLDGHRFGPAPRGHAFWERVHTALQGVGAAEIAEQAVGRLSGGQQQRVMLAAAIVSNPSLLLLDEPLANLDPANTADIVGLLDNLRRSRHLSVVLSAHDVNPLLGALDRVVYLAHGHAAVGGVEEVIRTDVLSRLYDHPVEVARFDGHLIVLAGDTAAHRYEDEKQDGGRSW